jgi:hypothetical protein
MGAIPCPGWGAGDRLPPRAPKLPSRCGDFGQGTRHNDHLSQDTRMHLSKGMCAKLLMVSLSNHERFLVGPYRLTMSASVSARREASGLGSARFAIQRGEAPGKVGVAG